MNELQAQIEQMHREMVERHPALSDPLRQLEAHLLHVRDATVNHIRHIRALQQQSEAIIRGELEALREVLSPRQVPPPIPDIEDRFVTPRFIGREAAE
jgi:hypothetical protein